MTAAPKPDRGDLLLALLLFSASWLPIAGAAQAVAYTLPFGVFAIALLTGRVRSRPGALLGIGALAITHVLALLLRTDSPRWTALALSLFTHGAVLLALLSWRKPEDLYRKVLYWVAVASILECGLALCQLLAATGGLSFRSGGEGDLAVGTLLTHSHLFVTKMWVQALILMVGLVFGFRSVWIVPGLVAAVLGALLGSALMASALFVGALFLLLLLVPSRLFSEKTARSLRWFKALAPVLAVASAAGLYVQQPMNFEYLTRTLNQVGEAMRGGRSMWQGKPTAFVRSVDLLAQRPEVLFFGTGIGHFSNRAAMILTGEYLSSKPAWLPVEMTDDTSERIYPLWNAKRLRLAHMDGVLNQPFHSIQSLLVEWGLLGCAILGLLGLGAASRLVGARNQRSPEEAALRVTALALLVVVPVLFLSDNWLEYPSFMLPVWLLLSMGLSVSGTQDRKASAWKT